MRLVVDNTRPAPHLHMLAAELMYFHGAPLAHVVAYTEHLREKRRHDHMRQVERRIGSRRRKL